MSGAAYWMFPAHAGMTRHFANKQQTEEHVPRPCGDDPPDRAVISAVTACSPLMRG